MADDDRQGEQDADELGALSEVRAALEAVERQQDGAARERRRLRERLEALLEALREDALLLTFDQERDLADAGGAVADHLGVEPAELVEHFEDFADEETVDALDEANRAVLDDDGSPACLSDGFLRAGSEELAITFIHLRRSNDDGEPVGTEVIGLVAPVAEPHEEAAEDAADPFDTLLEHIGSRLLDDAGEAGVTRAVQTFGDFLLAARVVVNRYDEDGRRFSAVASWLRGDTRPLDLETRGISISELPWAYSALGAGEAVVISENAALPADAGPEMKLYARGDVKSSLLVPMVRRDTLLGFLSVQAAHEERDWDERDIARARKFVMLLSAALAREDAETAARAARDEAERAAGAAVEAEERAGKRGAETERELEELSSEAETLRERVTKLEEDGEQLRREGQAAGDAVDDAKRQLEAARRDTEAALAEVDGLRQEADDARAAQRRLRDDAEGAQRRSEEAAADAHTAREELDGLREQLQHALREAAELRAAAATRETAPAARSAAGSALADDDEASEDFGPDPFKVTRDALERRGFDPDATLELEPLRRAGLQAGDGDEEAGDGVDSLTLGWDNDAGDHRGAGDEAAGDDDDAAADDDAGGSRNGAFGKLRGATPAGAGETPSRWKEEKTSWEDRTGEVDLPAFLLPDEDDDAVGDEAADPRGPVRDDVDNLAAARQAAREVAGRHDDLDDDDDFDDHDDDFDDPHHDFDDDEDHDDGRDLDDRPDDSPAAGELAALSRRAEVERTGELDAFRPRRGAAPGAARAAALPDLAGIDANAGLQDVGGNVELYRNLLHKFRNDYLGAGTKIRSAVDKGNIELAHLLLHAVKGVAGVLGAVRVRDTADELETHLIGGDPDATRAAVDSFRIALDEAVEAIGGMDDEVDEAAPAAPAVVAGGPDAHISDPMVLRSYLSGLRQHLMAEKVRQCQLVMREITARNWPSDYNQRVAELADLVEAGEFGAARETYDELMKQFTAG